MSRLRCARVHGAGHGASHCGHDCWRTGVPLHVRARGRVLHEHGAAVLRSIPLQHAALRRTLDGRHDTNVRDDDGRRRHATPRRVPHSVPQQRHAGGGGGRSARRLRMTADCARTRCRTSACRGPRCTAGPHDAICSDSRQEVAEGPMRRMPRLKAARRRSFTNTYPSTSAACRGSGNTPLTFASAPQPDWTRL